MPLDEGEPAPWAGQLLTPALAIELGQKAERCEEVRKLEAETMSAVCKIKIDGAAAVRGLVIEQHVATVRKLEEALERSAALEAEALAEAAAARSDKWTFALIGTGTGGAVGVALTVAVGVGAVWAAARLAEIVVAGEVSP